MSHHDRAESSARLVAHLQPTIHQPALPPPSSSSSHRMLARTGVVTHTAAAAAAAAHPRQPPNTTLVFGSACGTSDAWYLSALPACSVQHTQGGIPARRTAEPLMGPCSTSPCCCWPRPAMPPYSSKPPEEHPTSWCPPQPPTQLTMLKGLLAATCSFRPDRTPTHAWQPCFWKPPSWPPQASTPSHCSAAGVLPFTSATATANCATGPQAAC